jgi:hypothetical protein
MTNLIAHIGIRTTDFIYIKTYFLDRIKEIIIPGKRILAIIPIKTMNKLQILQKINYSPGNTIRNNGKSFNIPATRHPALACVRFFAANVRCTIT